MDELVDNHGWVPPSAVFNEEFSQILRIALESMQEQYPNEEERIQLVNNYVDQLFQFNSNLLGKESGATATIVVALLMCAVATILYASMSMPDVDIEEKEGGELDA